jgi:hypothetical protein
MPRLTIKEHEGRLLHQKAMLAHNLKELEKLKKDTEELLDFVNKYEAKIEESKAKGLLAFKI